MTTAGDAGMVTALLAVPVVLVALFAIPVTLTFRMAWPENRDNDVRLGWAFGLVKLRLASETTEPTTSGRRAPRSEEGAAKSTVKFIAAFRLPAFRRRVLRLLADVWRAFHMDDVAVGLRVGLDDPADTGQLWSLLGPVSALLSTVSDAALSVQPVFGEATVAVEAEGRVRVVPLRLVYLAAGFVLSPPAWQGFERMRAAV